MPFADNNGVITLAKPAEGTRGSYLLTPGEYWLKETKAPEGFTLPEDVWTKVEVAPRTAANRAQALEVRVVNNPDTPPTTPPSTPPVTPPPSTPPVAPPPGTPPVAPPPGTPPVTPPAAPPTGGVPPSQPVSQPHLARTGASVGGVLLVALALLASGAVLIGRHREARN
nr:prealbumin-like fold domain-containing protein [Corynebacterium sp. 76QC2CO]